jgi:hypothetical protein
MVFLVFLGEYHLTLSVTKLQFEFMPQRIESSQMYIPWNKLGDLLHPTDYEQLELALNVFYYLLKESTFEETDCNLFIDFLRQVSKIRFAILIFASPFCITYVKNLPIFKHASKQCHRSFLLIKKTAKKSLLHPIIQNLFSILCFH